MAPNIALLLCLGFVAWLFYRYPERRAGVSVALWIPLGWLFIVSSRSVSEWIGAGRTQYTIEQLADGSPIDSLVFLVLIVAGITVLFKRNVNWATLWRRNCWLFIFFIYLGLSVLWSDYPFVALKRWIKDLGNVVMVLVVLSDQNPIQAVRFLLARGCYLLIPLSVVFIKYVPNLGRSYDPWFGIVDNCGVATDKNILGMALFACAISLMWMLLQPNPRRTRGQARVDFIILLSMGGMTIWLLQQAHCSTALSCTMLGAVIILLTRSARIRAHPGLYCAALGALLLCLDLVVNIPEALAGLVGRDMTLTGRTDIWIAVLKERTDPLFGAGYYSFWMGDRVARLSANFFYLLNEAHNTYLEIYLNSGLIGIVLLFALILSTGIRIKKEAMNSEPFGAFRLACFFSMLLYGVTEAYMNRLNIVWFLFLLVVTDYPRRRGFKNQATRFDVARYDRLVPSI